MNFGLLNTTKKSISDILIIPMLESLDKPIELANMLRNKKIPVEIYLNEKKLKAKMKYADKLEIPYVIVYGEDEAQNQKIVLKEMKTGIETKFDILNGVNEIADYIKNK